METPHSLQGSFLDAMLELCWSQWTAIGLAGVHASTVALADPEALMLATLVFGRHDPRLFDEMLDWVHLNDKRVDLARLRRMAKDAEPVTRRLVGVVGELLAKADSGRWKPVQQDQARESAAVYAAEPLFLLGGTPAPLWAGQDETFASAGFVRGPIELRGMSRKPDPRSAPALRFRARALCGVGAKAETLTYLWTHEWAHGRVIAERSAYDQAAVARYLTELADGRLATTREEGRRLRYRLEDRLAAVGESDVRYIDWISAFRALTAVWGALSLDVPSEAPQAWWMRLAGVLQQQAHALGAEGFDVLLPDLGGWANTGPTVLAEALGGVTVRVRELAG